MKTNSFFYRMLCGAFLGISIIAPGISGSIMAVMMGIYDDLILIVSNPFKQLKKNIIYLFPMGIGAVISILLLLQALDFLFLHYPIPSYLLFMSLILGSVPTVVDEIKTSSFKKKYFWGIAVTFLLAFAVGIMAKSTVDFGIRVDADSRMMYWYFAFCGAVAGILSMVPGMSVSMVLMLFGVYQPLLELITGIMSPVAWFTTPWYMDLLLLIIVGVAFLAGMVIFSNISKVIFEKYHGFAFSLVLGFMLGSVLSIFPGFPRDLLQGLFSLLAIALGVMISVLFKNLGKKFNV